MPRYLATLKSGDQIRTTTLDEADARARIRDLYHVREPSFTLALDDSSIREPLRQLLEMIEQAERLLSRYREVVDQAQFESLVQERRQLRERIARQLGELEGDARQNGAP